VGQVDSLPTKEESADLPRSFANARDKPVPALVKGHRPACIDSESYIFQTLQKVMQDPKSPSVPEMPAPGVIPYHLRECKYTSTDQ
jgi:hypothetical protein